MAELLGGDIGHQVEERPRPLTGAKVEGLEGVVHKRRASRRTSRRATPGRPRHPPGRGVEGGGSSVCSRSMRRIMSLLWVGGGCQRQAALTRLGTMISGRSACGRSPRAEVAPDPAAPRGRRPSNARVGLAVPLANASSAARVLCGIYLGDATARNLLGELSGGVRPTPLPCAPAPKCRCELNPNRRRGRACSIAARRGAS